MGGVSVLALVAMLGAHPASAQTAGAPSSGGAVELDTIDIKGKGQTATGPIDGYIATESAAGSKTSTPLIKTPQAISVIGAKEIRDQQAQSTDEATRYSPGIHSQTFGSDSRNDWFLIRGFSEQETGYYLDGLQMFSTSFATWKLEPWNLERIEVVRGPASVLYGGGNPGGLINAISKMPTFTTFGQVEAGVNEFGNVYGAADVGGVAGAKNEWSYRFTSLGRIGGTQTDFTDNDRIFVAPSLSYKPDDATLLTILGQYQHDWTNGQNFLPYEGTVTKAPFGRIPTSLFTSEPSLDKFERDQTMIGYRFETAINPDVIIRQNTRYGHLDVNSQTLYGVGYAAPPTATTADLSRFNFVTTPSVDQLMTDNQAEFHFDTWALHNVALFGLDYKHYNLRDSQGFALGPTLSLLNPVYTNQTPTRSRYNSNTTVLDQVGTYAQDQISFDRFTMVLSGRHDFVDLNTRDRVTGTSIDTSPGAWSGKVGGIYNFDSGFSPYVSYSTSFNPIIGTNFSTGLPLVPETGEQVEVGLKYQSPVLPITAGLALFDLTRQNVLTTDPTFVLGSIQSGEQRSRGLEAEVRAQLSDGLSAIGTFTAYELEITKDLDPTLIGKVPTNTPQRFGSLWLDYTIPVGNFQGVGFGAGVRYNGQSFADPANTLRVPEFVVGDAAIHYERDHWRAAVNVSNFTDEVYVGSCSSATACFYGDRRKLSASLAYRW
ncbi:TonB-dependent siderophore receptor [Lichenifustis flavocetrariae]|uniref:TonB-dependent siderophore receptor n=1 Tax=Lichenifustis flavocetrariae TaxID=2949735 RepID=A0AA42CNB3_9HYPH|nr:TonB-dependent siderophore receptor [Lichenifustis flavocetrariae]MCW6509200.1 TonB-dependent siderophore receptor [Lichenifustis flavocetrariae]